MSETSHTPISSLGEFGLIDRIKGHLPPLHDETLMGVGDDAAVIRNVADTTLFSADMLVEGLHFDLAYHPLPHLGYKAAMVNFSDICAMNALPAQITVSLAISNRFSVEAVDALYKGFYQACVENDVDLVGGDITSSTSGLVISIAVLGQADQDSVVYRSGARVGDMLCVTGDLGASYLGLQILEREKRIFLEHPEMQPDLEGQDYLIGRQLKPTARMDMIKIFKKAEFKPTSMIDISDGLASEVIHIGQSSEVGVIVEEGMVPIHNDAKLKAIEFGLDPITCALSGGEDYELLFTASPKDLDKVKMLPDVAIIGDIVPASEGYKLHTTGGNIHTITAQGWNHFSPPTEE